MLSVFVLINYYCVFGEFALILYHKVKYNTENYCYLKTFARGEMSDKYENEREEREKDDQNPGSGDDRAQATVIPGDDISQNSSEHLISELTESGSRLGDSNAVRTVVRTYVAM